MIHRILKLLVRFAAKTYFKSITVRKAESVPEKCPLIVVSNHPGTFMDPIVIQLQFRKSLYFLAKASSFSSITARIYSGLNMIPLYRAQDSPGQMNKNEESFETCYRHLEKKGHILIFPEGVSITQRKLEKIKTGAARIALGAEDENDFRLGVEILPIGLNYTDPHRFNSRLYISFAPAIKVSAYASIYREDPMAAVRTLTDDIRKSLEDQIVLIEDQKTDRLVKNIETIYKNKLLSELGYSPSDRDQGFLFTKNLARAITYFKETDPERVEGISRKVNSYFSNLARLNLKDHLLGKDVKKGSVLLKWTFDFLYLLLGFPFWLYGVVNNYLPYKTPYYIATSVAKDREWLGALFLTTGIFTFLFFYSIQVYLVGVFTGNPWAALAYFVSLPITGFFAFNYYRFYLNLKGKGRIFYLFMKRSGLVSRLIETRKQLIEEFDKARKEFNLNEE